MAVTPQFGQFVDINSGRVDIFRAKHNTCLINTNLGSVSAVNGKNSATTPPTEKKRRDEYESKYKRYKNKLTSILRYCEKQYYTDILDLNKGNMKETWKIINSLINKQSEEKKCVAQNFIAMDKILVATRMLQMVLTNFFCKYRSGTSK